MNLGVLLLADIAMLQFYGADVRRGRGRRCVVRRCGVRRCGVRRCGVLGATCLKELLQQCSTLIREDTTEDIQAVIQACEFVRVRH